MRGSVWGRGVLSVRWQDISGGAQWKDNHTHPLSTNVQLHQLLLLLLLRLLILLRLLLSSSAPVSAGLRLGDKYGRWSRTQRPAAHFSPTFVRSTTNTTAKGDKNLQAIFSRGEMRRRGRRGSKPDNISSLLYFPSVFFAVEQLQFRDQQSDDAN